MPKESKTEPSKTPMNKPLDMEEAEKLAQAASLAMGIPKEEILKDLDLELEIKLAEKSNDLRKLIISAGKEKFLPELMTCITFLMHGIPREEKLMLLAKIFQDIENGTLENYVKNVKNFRKDMK